MTDFDLDYSDPIAIGYVNYQGKYSIRRIIPNKIWFGATEWHDKPQPFLYAFDIDKQAYRDFALGDFRSIPETSIHRKIRHTINFLICAIGFACFVAVFAAVVWSVNMRYDCETTTGKECSLFIEVLPTDINKGYKHDI